MIGRSVNGRASHAKQDSDLRRRSRKTTTAAGLGTYSARSSARSPFRVSSTPKLQRRTEMPQLWPGALLGSGRRSPDRSVERASAPSRVSRRFYRPATIPSWSAEPPTGTPIRARIGHDQALGAGPTVPRRALMINCACASISTERCRREWNSHHGDLGLRQARWLSELISAICLAGTCT